MSRCSSLLMELIHRESASQNEADRSRTYSTEVNSRAENAASVIMCDFGNCKMGRSGGVNGVKVYKCSS